MFYEMVEGLGFEVNSDDDLFGSDEGMNPVNQPDPEVAKKSRQIGVIASPQEVRDLARAVEASRAGVLETSGLMIRSSRYGRNADNTPFVPVTLDENLMDKARSLRATFPSSGLNNAQRAIVALVETPRKRWVGFPSNKLIQEVITRVEAGLSAEFSSVDKLVNMLTLCSF